MIQSPKGSTWIFGGNQGISVTIKHVLYALKTWVVLDMILMRPHTTSVISGGVHVQMRASETSGTLLGGFEKQSFSLARDPARYESMAKH